MTRGRNLLELVRDRRQKEGLYDSPAYWDMKAERYQGLARSNWPSNTYNEELHAHQMATIDRLLGDPTGLQIADVGCGTGRTSLHLARRGARVHGFDFSSKALAVARQDAEEAGIDVDFALGNVLEPPPENRTGQFDVVLSLGCLTLACTDQIAFETAVLHLCALCRPGGRVLFVEPIHTSRLLRRILRLSVREWIEACERGGLKLLDRGALLFLPARFALAFRDLPPWLVAPTFRAGERLLELSPRMAVLGDYKWLVFRKTP